MNNRARTEQATEIEALKLDIADATKTMLDTAEQMDDVVRLARFGAMVSRDTSVGSIDKREILQYAILADIITPSVEATIEQLLKEEK
jgi:hypothetical protein